MSKNTRPAYLYYRDWAEQLLKLPENLRLRIDDAVKRYVLYGEEPTDNEVLYSMFNLMRTQIDRDEEKYREKCRKNTDNIQKRWQNNTATNVYDGIQTYTNDTNKDKDNNIKKRNNIKRKAAAFTPPSVSEVEEYVSDNGYTYVNPQQFIDHYTAVGWMVGRNKMKNWQAAVRNWNSRNRAFSSDARIYSPQQPHSNETAPKYQAL